MKKEVLLLLLPKCPLGPPDSAGSENGGLTRQVITAPGYKIGSMSRLFPHFEFVCLVVHSQLKPSKCPYLAPSLLSPPRKLRISMSHVVSLILHFYIAHSCKQPHCCIDRVSQSFCMQSSCNSVNCQAIIVIWQ